MNVDKHARREEKDYALVVLQVWPTYNEDNTITIRYGQNANIGTNNRDGTIDVLTLRILYGMVEINHDLKWSNKYKVTDKTLRDIVLDART